LTTLTLNRSTTAPVKARQNRPASPGTEHAERSKIWSLPCNGCFQMVEGSNFYCARQKPPRLPCDCSQSYLSSFQHLFMFLVKCGIRKRRVSFPPDLLVENPASN